nr:hypothetical protein [Tanacetum cinerariifolium]
MLLWIRVNLGIANEKSEKCQLGFVDIAHGERSGEGCGTIQVGEGVQDELWGRKGHSTILARKGVIGLLDSEDSTVTYMEVSSPFKDLLDIGSPGVVVYEYDGRTMHLPSLDYVPGPEHPPSSDYVHGLEHPPLPVYVLYVLKPAYLEFIPPEDDVLLAEEHPLPAAVSPTIDLPSYITKSDPEEDPEEEDDEDPEEDPADYPTNSDDDDKEEKSSGYDFDDEELLAIPTSPPSPLTSYSLPLPQIPSPPIPASLTHPLGYKAAMIWLRAESPSTSHPLLLPPPIVIPYTRASMAMMKADSPFTYILAPRSETPPSRTPPFLPIPLPTSSPPLLLPSTNRRAYVLEVTLPPQKRLCIAIGPRFEVEECSFAPTARPTGGFRAYYGFVDTLDAEIRRDPDREIGYEIIDVWEDLNEIVEEIPATDDDKLLMSGQLNSQRRDRRSHARTARLMESKARASREAWVQSMDASNMTRSESKMVALQSQQRPARDPTHPEVPKEASIIFSYDLKKMAPTRRTTRASPAMKTTTTPVTNAQLKALIDQGVADALTAHNANRIQNGDDSYDSGTGIRKTERTTLECTNTDFLKFENQVKFATCTLYGIALTWWKSHVKTVGQDATHSMSWSTLIKMMTAMRIFFKESDKIEKYVDGLLDMIHGSVMASMPKTMQNAVEFATKLMDKKIHTFSERQTENKRNSEDTSRNNQNVGFKGLHGVTTA